MAQIVHGSWGQKLLITFSTLCHGSFQRIVPTVLLIANPTITIVINIIERLSITASMLVPQAPDVCPNGGRVTTAGVHPVRLRPLWTHASRLDGIIMSFQGFAYFYCSHRDLSSYM